MHNSARPLPLYRPLLGLRATAIIVSPIFPRIITASVSAGPSLLPIDTDNWVGADGLHSSVAGIGELAGTTMTVRFAIEGVGDAALLCFKHDINRRWIEGTVDLAGYGRNWRIEDLLLFCSAGTQRLRRALLSLVDLVLENGYSSHWKPASWFCLTEQRFPPEAIQPAAFRWSHLV